MNSKQSSLLLVLSLCGASFCSVTASASSAQVSPKGSQFKGPVVSIPALKKPAPQKRLVVVQKPKKPAVTITGSLGFNAILGSQDNKFTNTVQTGTDASGNPKTTVSTEKNREDSNMFGLDGAHIEFQVKNALRSPLFNTWSANIVLSADRDKYASAAGKAVKRAYLTFRGAGGLALYLGNYQGVEGLVSYSGNNLAGVDGGIEANWNSILSPAFGTYAMVNQVGSTAEATKITLLSPRFGGVRIGASYTPSSNQYGSMSQNTSRNLLSSTTPGTSENLAMTIDYLTYIAQDLKLKLSGTWITANARTEGPAVKTTNFSMARNKGDSLAFGGVLEYKKFSFAAEYQNGGKSLQFSNDRTLDGATITLPDGTTADQAPGFPLDYTASKAKAPQQFNVGVRWVQAPYKFSAIYMQSWRKTGFGDASAKAKILNLSVTRNIAPGLDVYLSGFDIKTKNPSANSEAILQSQNGNLKVPAVTDNKGKILIAGVKTNF